VRREEVTELSSSGVSVINPITFNSIESIKAFVINELEKIFHTNFPVNEQFDTEKIITEIPEDIGNEVRFHFCQFFQHKKGLPLIMIADVTVHGEEKDGWIKYIS